MNTHTIASEIIRNAQAVRARLMGRGRVVNVLQEVLEAKAIRDAEDAKDRKAAAAARKIKRMERRRGLRVTDEQHEIAVELYAKGKTYLEIGEAIGKEFEVVAYHIASHRGEFRPRERTRPKASSEVKMPERVAIEVFRVLERHNGIKLADIYDGNKARAVSAARREVFHSLWISGVSVTNIARYFNRDPRVVRRSMMHFGVEQRT